MNLYWKKKTDNIENEIHTHDDTVFRVTERSYKLEKITASNVLPMKIAN